MKKKVNKKVKLSVYFTKYDNIKRIHNCKV